MNEKKIMCIICPMSCVINTSLGNTEELSGARCPRGIEYALQELDNPLRTFSTSIPVVGGDRKRLSVKPLSYVPRHCIEAIIRELATTMVFAPIQAGDTVIANLNGTGMSLIALQSISRVAR